MPVAALFTKSSVVLIAAVKLIPVILFLLLLALGLLAAGVLQKKRTLPDDYWDRC